MFSAPTPKPSAPPDYTNPIIAVGICVVFLIALASLTSSATLAVAGTAVLAAAVAATFKILPPTGSTR